MKAFVDANIFVRFLARDDLAKAERCLGLFENAQRGQIDLVTSEAIIGEVIYVLSSKRLYGQTRDQIARDLRPLLELRGLHIDHKGLILNALDRYETASIDFEDCLSIEHAIRGGLDGIFSYDRKLGREPGVVRMEP